MERCVAMAKHRSMDSLPEWSKGVDSSSTGANLEGSNPTAVTFAQAEQSQGHALTMRQATKLGPEWSLQGRFEMRTGSSLSTRGRPGFNSRPQSVSLMLEFSLSQVQVKKQQPRPFVPRRRAFSRGQVPLAGTSEGGHVQLTQHCSKEASKRHNFMGHTL